MKLARCAHEGVVWWGAVDGEVVTLLAPDSQISIGSWTAPSLKAAVLHPAGTALLEDVALLAPVSAPSKIICVGLNYRDHAIESGMSIPEIPMIFAKFPSSLVGPGAAIVLPEDSNEIDWEVELAVVIGSPARHVSESDALDFVLGYTVAVDVSARDLQISDGQFVRAKSYDTFCPVGPWLVTADELGDARGLGIGLTVNQETLQDSRTSELVFGVKEIIAFCSRVATLNPGDLILTGTPNGTGFGFKPPRYLNPGDEVTAWVEGIGELTNPVAVR
ncbi:MAG: fumarylacetoacetate hydrolase family protein [Actinomycetota bacterium]|nr:fumarylacetoacetate hydrolase family protein [Actinomycetota bacterium]